MKKNIAIFASGGGSNAEVIINHFINSDVANITLIVTNKETAHVIERAKNHNIPYYVHSNEAIDNGELVAKMKAFKIDFIVLAGYLKRIHPDLISHYPNNIVNIHPALLPKFGGKGMYGMHVHRAVVQAEEKTSGITIHYVNENYDEGNIIEQHECVIPATASPELVQKLVLELEHKYFAQSIDMLVRKL